MLETVKALLGSHIKQYPALYGLCFGVFVLGIVLGACTVNFCTDEQLTALGNYLGSTFDVIEASSLRNREVFLESVLIQLRTFIPMVAVSFFTAGVPLIVGFLGLRGYMLGFSVGILTGLMGVKGFVFSFVSQFLHGIVIVPALIFLSVVCIRFPLDKRARQGGLRTGAAGEGTHAGRHLLRCLLILLPLLFGSVIEGYVAPIIVKSLAGWF